jgi:hypothetical protein
MATDPAQAALPAGISANAFSSLFQAVNGVRNRRALAALIGCTVLGVLVAGLLMAMSGALGFVATLLAFLVYVVAVGTGVNAAGLLHMDGARGISPRSTVDALIAGLMCIPKLIVLGLALLAVEIAVFIVLAIVIFICKIPFLGPVLFVVVFPASVIVAGVTVVGLFLCLVLSLPAIWMGATITRALAQTLAIARSRLIETVLLLLFVGFLAFAVALIVFGVLFAGLLPTLGMSASIVGFGGGMGGLGGMMGMMQGGGGGAMIAGAIGGLLLWAVAASLVGQVHLLGLCLVYLRVTEGLDLSATEAALRQTLDEARRRTAELGEKAKSAASRGAGSDSAMAASTGSAAAAAGASAAAASAGFFEPAASGATMQGPGAVTPAYTPPAAPHYTPPPAYMPPAGASVDPDISLPFDEAPAAPPAYGVPPAYVPPPAQPATPVAPPAAAATTCPQCLSPVTTEDVFCGVCGYRLT